MICPHSCYGSWNELFRVYISLSYGKILWKNADEGYFEEKNIIKLEKIRTDDKYTYHIFHDYYIWYMCTAWQ